MCRYVVSRNHCCRFAAVCVLRKVTQTFAQKCAAYSASNPWPREIYSELIAAHSLLSSARREAIWREDRA